MALHSDNSGGAEVNNSKKLPRMTILSIDLDWIMEPCIWLYNDRVHSDDPIYLADINIQAPGLNLNADIDKFASLNKVLFSKNCWITKPDLCVADSHDAIIKAIQDWNIDKPYHIVNIDHHHDCGYDERLKLPTKLTCGNWVTYLAMHDTNFCQYTWIHNFNSDRNITNEAKEVIPEPVLDTNINVATRYKYDKIFICRSPGWVPESMHPLIDSLILAFETFTKK